jgi:hypothetical protein
MRSDDFLKAVQDHARALDIASRSEPPLPMRDHLERCLRLADLALAYGRALNKEAVLKEGEG